MIGFLVKNEAKNIYKDKICLFFNVLALPSVICWPIPLFNASCGFQKYQNGFNQNTYVEKSLAVKHFCYEHT